MIVKNCIECPFRQQDWDRNADSPDTTDWCNLSLLNRREEGIIAMYDLYDEKGKPNPIKLKVPDWCELRQGFITIELKE